MQNEVTGLIAETHGAHPVGRTDKECDGLKKGIITTPSISHFILQDVKTGLGVQILLKLHNIHMTSTDAFPLDPHFAHL